MEQIIVRNEKYSIYSTINPDNISNHNNDLGNETLFDTTKTVKGCINALNTRVNGKQNILVYGSRTGTASGGYITFDLGSDYGNTAPKMCMIASGYVQANAQVPVVVAIQSGRYLRCFIPNGSYSNSAISVEFWFMNK